MGFARTQPILPHWLSGNITELFDVDAILEIRCPRGIGPHSPGLDHAMRAERMSEGIRFR